MTKRYGSICACDQVSLEVQAGEFVTLLGPSGSGKTTTLRIVAGFVRPDEGNVVLDERDLTLLPPHKRDIGMVFQHYALFPHMTAGDNVAFPLKMRGVKGSERRQRAQKALELVHLAGLDNRFPSQLSGGQQQRVALARAIVFSPTLLLMDEPLGALDKKLREALQLEISHLSRRLGGTVVYVTHDQEEALAMSDRIAIYNEGRIEQIGTGQELYERPASLFVASFMGESNIFTGRLETHAGGAEVVSDACRLRVAPTTTAAAGLDTSTEVAVVLRPEHATLCRAGEAVPEATNVFTGTVTEVIYLGATRKCAVALADGTVLHARLPAQDSDDLTAGGTVSLAWRVERGAVVSAETSHVAAADGEAARQESDQPMLPAPEPGEG